MMLKKQRSRSQLRSDCLINSENHDNLRDGQNTLEIHSSDRNNEKELLSISVDEKRHNSSALCCLFSSSSPLTE